MLNTGHKFRLEKAVSPWHELGKPCINLWQGLESGKTLAGIRALSAIALGAALAFAAPAAAQQVAVSGTAELLLRNGQWAWLEDAAYRRAGGSDDISILISIPGQIAYVYRDGVLIAASTVSTGKPGKATPTGEFPILQKRVHHRSNIYSNAPMPFMQRLTWTGIALHAGVLPGYPASHGCIRFPREFARRLFEITQLGTNVSVIGHEIDDPRVRRGAPRLAPQLIAQAPPSPPPAAPFLRADFAALRTGAFDVVTASNDVIIPLVEVREVTTDGGIAFAPMRPVVQALPRRRR